MAGVLPHSQAHHALELKADTLLRLQEAELLNRRTDVKEKQRYRQPHLVGLSD